MTRIGITDFFTTRVGQKVARQRGKTMIHKNNVYYTCVQHFQLQRFFFNQTPLNDNISLRTFCCFSFSTSLIPLMTKEQLSSASGSITDKRQ